MKVQHFFLFSLLTFILFSACKKDKSTERRVFGQVLEYGTEIPIEGASVELYSCTTDAFSTGCGLTKTVLTDANGLFEMTFQGEGNSMLTAKADKYFDYTEIILNNGMDNEERIILDPHAWLNLTVKNVAPAEEFDKVFLSSLISPTPGSSEEYIGIDVNLNYTIKKYGNRDLRIGWNTYTSGVLIERFKDTLYLPAHDTLYYEINY